MPAPSKYNPNYHNPWAWSLAAKGATDEEIAAAFGISKRTLERWKLEYDDHGKPIIEKDGEKKLSEFGKMLLIGKESADANVEMSLYKKAVGFRATDVRKIIESDPVTGITTVNRTEINEREVLPDTMACMYWLNNRKRKTGEWSQRQDDIGDMDDRPVIVIKRE